MRNGKVEHAWYSNKQAKHYEEQNRNNYQEHTFMKNIYKLKNGKEVCITEVSLTEKSYWDDAQYLGEVDDWVRTDGEW